jgi:hypothetical protein
MIFDPDKSENIPQELKALPQWICWKWGNRDGKATKIPINPKNNGFAKTTDPKTWTGFEMALRAANYYKMGIGFVFTAEAGIVGIDMDGVIDHELIGWMDSYAEKSVSGNGAHIYVKAILPDHRGRKSHPLEIYSDKRFFVVTGDVIRPGAIETRIEQVNEFLGQFPAEKEDREPDLSGLGIRQSPRSNAPETDQGLLDKMFASANGQQILSLWDGHLDGHDGDHSKADAALLSHLRFWTGGDKARAFDLFSRSGLYRKKWDRTDYRERTWKAIDSGEVYDPVKEAEAEEAPVYQAPTKAPQQEFISAPPGAAEMISSYFNQTARIPQPGFAVHTSLAVLSAVLGRRFRTSQGNFPSLYYLCLAKSGTGKEHCKTVAEKALTFMGMGKLIGSSGFASPGAVMSALRDKPCQLAVIDEFGKYLEAMKDKRNIHQQGANKLLMEATGRLHGTLRPIEYSRETLKKDERKAVQAEDKTILRPALTILGLTTPSTFFDALGLAQVRDGFLGRFLVHHSALPRVPGRRIDTDADPDEALKEWAELLENRFAGNLAGVITENATIAPSPQTLSFDHDADQILIEFEAECVKRQNELDERGLAEMAGRTAEYAMRLALIAALSRDPLAEEIIEADAEWAVAYMRHALEGVLEATETRMADSEYEKNKNAYLQAIRSRGARGVTNGEMGREKPFRTQNEKDRQAILKDLENAGLIVYRKAESGYSAGKQRVAWIPIGKSAADLQICGDL